MVHALTAPVGFSSRSSWEASRRQRVAPPSFIELKIDLESMIVRQVGTDAASVSFVQLYRSDRYSDTVQTTLGLVRQAGDWKIASETSR